MNIQSFAVSDVGMKRKINQDSFFKDEKYHLYIVADGMGGHQGGEVASQMAVNIIHTHCIQSLSQKKNQQAQVDAKFILEESINLASQKIHEEASQKEELFGMGTTVVCVLIFENRVYIAQVGDSRVYLIRAEGVWQLTEDHSLLNEEIRAGRIEVGQESQYQYKNVITRSVGYEKKVIVDIYDRILQAGDFYLLCSDGLSGLVKSEEIKSYLLEKGIEEGAKALVNEANQRGGDDNITVLVCHVDTV